MAKNENMARLESNGVSVWLDSLSRDLMGSGKLQSLIDEDGVCGVTTNPNIFYKAIHGSSLYDEEIKEGKGSASDILYGLMVKDVRSACDIFRPTAEKSDWVNGRVSLEVDPNISDDSEAMIAAAQKVWEKIERKNAMVKIPATPAGFEAARFCIGHGISVNMTLLFSLPHYQAAANAFLEGAMDALRSDTDLRSLGSVASLFVSRIDTKVDAMLDRIGTREALSLKGKAAIANSTLAYGLFEKIFSSDPRWAELERAGVRPQRLLWASTSVKNPAYPDCLYVDSLVAPKTVNTMPLSTLEAEADHGKGEPSDFNFDESRRVIEGLSALGIDIEKVSEDLQKDGIDQFKDSWNSLISEIEKKM